MKALDEKIKKFIDLPFLEHTDENVKNSIIFGVDTPLNGFTDEDFMRIINKQEIDNLMEHYNIIGILQDGSYLVKTRAIIDMLVLGEDEIHDGHPVKGYTNYDNINFIVPDTGQPYNKIGYQIIRLKLNLRFVVGKNENS